MASERIWLHVLITVPFSPSKNFSSAFRIDIRSSNAFCLHFDEDESMEDLMGRVRIRREALQRNPLAFLSILFEEHAHASEVYRTFLDKEVVTIEQLTRMSSLHIGMEGDQSLHAADYETLTRRIHGCNTNLIFLDHVLEFERRLGDLCKNAYTMFWDLRRQHGLEDLPAHQHVEFQQSLDYHVNDSIFRRSQAQALQKRIHSQMSVVYSLVSQRDSRINLLVAEESRKIAGATMHDSKAMKLIALLTLIFLPATLMATIFSTGIFDLSGTASTEGRATVAVAPLWWVFVVTSVGLTAVVLVAWVVFLKWRSKGSAGDTRYKDGA